MHMIYIYIYIGGLPSAVGSELFPPLSCFKNTLCLRANNFFSSANSFLSVLTAVLTAVN